MNIKTSVELITPETAECWLEGNTGNRNIKMFHVKHLAEIIKRGEWQVSNDAITFDDKGRLLNGQHRLSAIVLSGIAVECVVIHNAKTESFGVMDTGKTRTLADITMMPRKTAELMRLANIFLYGNEGKKPTAKQVEPIINSRIKKESDDLISYCSSTKQTFSSAPVRLAAVIAICDGEDKNFIYKTYASLVTFKIEDMTSASRAFVKQVDSSKVSVRSSVFDVFTRALKVFKSGESIVNRITCTDSDIDSAKAYARSVIKKAIEATP